MATQEPLGSLAAGDVLELLEGLVRAGADYADIFAEDSALRSLAYSEGRITTVGSGRRFGVGVRFLRRGRQYLAHTPDVTIDGVRRAVVELAGLLGAGAVRTHGSSSGAMVVDIDRERAIGGGAVEPLPAAGCDELAHAAAAGVADVVVADGCSIDLEASRRTVRILNTAGADVATTTFRTELTVDCTIDRGDRLDNGRRNRGELVPPAGFGVECAHELGRLAGEQVLSRADSVPAPVGVVDVILAPGTAGVVFHETVGHGLEADLVQSFESVYSGREGSRVGAAGVNVVDDGTRSGGWGSAPFDDEGTASCVTELVHDGILLGYLSDRATVGRSASGELTANSRRATYADPPFVRMTNTIVRPGDAHPSEIIADTDRGIFVGHLRGGGFNPGTGQFIFSTSEASLIERGRIVGPIRNATFVGNALDALIGVDGIGDDFELVAGGRCGKRNQTLPVGFGAPTVRIRGLTVGGR